MFQNQLQMEASQMKVSQVKVHLPWCYAPWTKKPLILVQESHACSGKEYGPQYIGRGSQRVMPHHCQKVSQPWRSRYGSYEHLLETVPVPSRCAPRRGA
jgi:hypothetical protein